ncbi:MAG: hypothetical protein K2Q18_15755 [Bdellovibrionales bacterium]|nr:hypothetical protein [Bdellovibrionales bacterium]
MKKLSSSILITFLSSCALLNPNPNRKDELAKALILRPFTTDYCSEWPDGRINDPKRWADCCFTHDISYWMGGTEEERKSSDRELKSCVRNNSDSLNGFLMYMGVRIGGDPGEASYSWGYGWTKDREYTRLAKEERQKAKELLLSSEYNQHEKEKALINNFINEKLKD